MALSVFLVILSFSPTTRTKGSTSSLWILKVAYTVVLHEIVKIRNQVENSNASLEGRVNFNALVEFTNVQIIRLKQYSHGSSKLRKKDFIING